MPTFKIKEKRKQQQEIIYDDRMNDISEAYKKIGYTYTPDRQEKEVLAFEQYKQKFKSTYSYELQQAFRIQHRGKEYLVYRIKEEVVGNDNRVYECEHIVGYHSLPLTRPVRKNEFGEAIDLEIVGQRLVYEQEFNQDFVQDLFDKSKIRPNALAVGRGSDHPPDIITSNILTVFNEQEFVQCAFDDLVEANVNNFLKSEFGGVNQYKQFKQSQSQQSQQAQTNVPK